MGRIGSCTALLFFAALCLASPDPAWSQAISGEAEDEGSEARDHPLGAALYGQLRREGDPTAVVPENGLANAIERVKALRRAITNNATRPASVRTFAPAAPGQPEIVTIAGIPVGEIAGGQSLQRGGDPRAGVLRLEQEPLLPRKAVPRRAQQEPPGGIKPSGWKWLGPANVGGRTRAILVHPNKPEIMWVASVAGGVWKSVDAGQSWGPLADFMTSLNVVTLALDPGNPDILYAGTGEHQRDLTAMRGAGLFRSTDGGATWQQVPATTGNDFWFVNRIAITGDGAAMLLATSVGLFRSTNYRAELSQITFDMVADLVGRPILDVRCHPKAARSCVAGGWGRTAYRSDDGGQHWKAASGLPNPNAHDLGDGRVELACAAADSKIVYASVDNNGGEIYRSSDGGATFELRSTGTCYLGRLKNQQCGGSQGWHDNAIWVGDPTKRDLVIVGGIDLHRSTDGGRTLTQISDWKQAPLSAHADNHVIVSHPQYNGTTNRVVYFGNDGGIYRNDDVLRADERKGWLALNNNYGVTQFFGAGGNPVSGRIIAGAQDNYTLMYQPPPGPNTGPDGYTILAGGDGGYSAADPKDPSYLYGEYVFLMIHRSIKGASSEYIYEGIEEAGQSALFIAPFILDPANPSTMLAGGQSLWRSRDVKAPTPGWGRIKEPVTPRPGRRALISAIEARASQGGPQSDLVWVGYADGQVYRSSTGGADQPVWERVDENGPQKLPASYVTRIRIDPTDTATVYVAFTSAWTADNHLWKSTDRGDTWTPVFAQLPEATVYDVAMHPKNTKLLYAATEFGVFASGDAGATWWPTNQGPANVAVSELFWMDEKLVAVTFGRGLFWIDLSQGVAEAYASVAKPGAVAKASNGVGQEGDAARLPEALAGSGGAGAREPKLAARTEPNALDGAWLMSEGEGILRIEGSEWRHPDKGLATLSQAHEAGEYGVTYQQHQGIKCAYRITKAADGRILTLEAADATQLLDYCPSGKLLRAD